MKTFLFLLFFSLLTLPSSGQQPLNFTITADGLMNPQLAKSRLYFLGTGLRAEVSKSLNGSRNQLFAQLGYARFFQNSTSAFSANIGLVNIGYRYQSRKSFGATVGVGVQYWSERMRIRFPDYSLDETLNNLIPSATVGIAFRVMTRYRLGLDNRVLLKPETGSINLRNNLALSIGYTL